MPSLFSFLPAAKPGVPARDHERRDAAAALRAIGHRHRRRSCRRCAPCVMNCLLPVRTQSSPSRRAVVRIAPASLPALASVSAQAPMISPLRERHEVLLLLRLAAEHGQVRDAQAVVRGDRQRDRRIDARQLFDADAVVERRHPGAAVRLGHLDAHQPERGQLRQQVRRKRLRLVPLHDVRTDLGLGELADRAAQELVIGRRTKIHARMIHDGTAGTQYGYGGCEVPGAAGTSTSIRRAQGSRSVS